MLYNEATIEQAAFFSLQAVDSSRNRLFPGKTGVGQEVVEERRKERELGRERNERSLSCRGVSIKVRAGCARLARVCLHGKQVIHGI